MSLILRNTKGSPLTWTEMDDNLTYLEGLNADIIEKTYIDLMSEKVGNKLEVGTRYFITDRDIWIDALDTNKLAIGCKRHFRIVKDEHYIPHIDSANNYLGIYGQGIARGSVPNSDGSTVYYAIWGGRMWERDTTGSDTPGTSNETIDGGWTMVDITDNTYYESKIFDIKYNFDDDIIWEQSDDRDNIIKRQSSLITYIDITDWGNTKIYNNENFGIFNNFLDIINNIANNSNNGYIGNNSNNGNIMNNSNNGNIFNNSNIWGVIFGNSNSGHIQRNSNSEHIRFNSNTGDIDDNSNSGDIDDNSNSGHIQSNSNSGNIYNNSNSDIYNNSNNGNIQHNSNNGSIANNSNGGHIYYNFNIGDIYNNSNDGGNPNNSIISNNANNGSIQDNSNNGNISHNSNNGVILDNSNNSIIFNNSNNGNISYNSNNGAIRNNSNNGYIYSNSSSGSTTFSIRYNTNSGYIRGNISTANINIQYNTNNGNIGPVSGTMDRSTSIEDIVLDK